MYLEDAKSGTGRRAAWTIICLAVLLSPALATAQSFSGPFAEHPLGDRAAKKKPACVYKEAMSAAEIEACTGHPVHYNYTPVQEPPPSTNRAAVH